MESITPKYYTAREAATIIGVSYRLILKWISEGQLKCYRIGGNGMIRVSNEQIREFLENHEIPEFLENHEIPAESEAYQTEASDDEG